MVESANFPFPNSYFMIREVCSKLSDFPYFMRLCDEFA